MGFAGTRPASGNDQRESRRMPLPAFVFAALAFAFTSLIGGLAGPAEAAPKKAVKPAVKVLTGSQAAAARGQIKVRVTVPAARRAARGKKRRSSRARQVVRLAGTVKQPWSKAARLKPARVRLAAGGRRTLTIKVPAAGISLLRNCGAPTVTVTARGLRKGKLRGWTRKSSRRLAKQSARCAVPAEVDLSKADRCDFIAPAGNPCLSPFPNDFYTEADASSDTGKRVSISADATPVNIEKTPIGVEELNRSDGFSPGPMLTIRVPGLGDQAAFDRSGLVPITRMSDTYKPEQSVVLIDAETGKRQLIWAEMDYNAAKDSDRNLIVRPGKNLVNGHRYIVALRGLKESDGTPIEAPAGFRLYRDAKRTDNPVVEKRRAGFESVFASLKKAGIDRSSLYLAWDFTVASSENLTGRMLSIRDRAFKELGDENLADGKVQGGAPQFAVTSVENDPNEENARTVTGTFQVPCFLDTVGCVPGSTFNLDADQKPIRIAGNTMTARFTCNIPDSATAVEGGTRVVERKVRPSLYGHGLFGEYHEVNSRNVRQLGTENGVMTCGTDWSGMSQEDVLAAAAPALLDLTKFNALPDRLQQGFLNFLFLGRLMIHQQGFNADPAFRFDGESVIDTSDLFYYGNSQGGIAGGALTAVSPDFTRSVLYVPGMNYSTLLTRSIDFDTYGKIMYPRYVNHLERPVIFALMQMMWDRGEPNGYANHMTTNPLPNTPAHTVLIEMAYGDHEVANVATEVEARTIGAPLRMPAVDADRQPDGFVEPFFGLDVLGDLNGPAADGSGFFVWDTGPKRMVGGTEFGTEPLPITNTAPDRATAGVNPHDTVIRSSPIIRKQIADFLSTNGKITDPCGAEPCYAAGWKGWP